MKYKNKYTGAILEAFQYDGDMQNSDGEYYVPEWAVEALKTGKLYYADMDAGGMPPLCVKHELEDCYLLVMAGDYVVKFEDGRIRPFSAKDFEKVYEAVLEEQCQGGLDQSERLTVDADFALAPIHVLDANFAQPAEIKGNFLEITKKYAAFHAEKVDEIILKEAAKLAAELGIDCTIVIDESRLKRVLELGVAAFCEEKGENNG